ncbi:hypothetical protein Gpo141_00005208 [Globisporangium polare]
MLRPVRKLILHHPGKLTAWLVAFSSMYTFARVLVLQYTLGALHYWIYRYPSNFPHVVFVPLYYISVTGAFFAAIYHDCVVLQSGLWKYVLPIPLTVSGRLYRIVGVPVYAFAIAAIEAVQFFRNPSMESDLSRLAVYFQGLRDNVYLDDLLVKKVLFDIKWQAWTLQTATSPSTAAYIRLPLELLCAMIVCVIYGIAIFCNEPGQDGEELRQATRNNDLMRVKNILARGVNPNSKSDDGSTPLHICAQQALVSPAKVLLENKADPNVSDRLGFTALHWAVQIRREEMSASNRLEMIRLLMRNGADPRKADPSGVTPLSIASKKENESSLGVLQEMMTRQGGAAIESIDGRSHSVSTSSEASESTTSNT